MDEYVGLPRDHPESYHSFMWNNLFKHIDIKCVANSVYPCRCGRILDSRAVSVLSLQPCQCQHPEWKRGTFAAGV
jgi:hypothetical protein